MFVGVGTKIDPTLCRADRMVGQVLGAVGALPEIYTELVISYFLLRRLLGVRTEGDKKAAKVSSHTLESNICETWRHSDAAAEMNWLLNFQEIL